MTSIYKVEEGSTLLIRHTSLIKLSRKRTLLDINNIDNQLDATITI